MQGMRLAIKGHPDVTLSIPAVKDTKTDVIYVIKGKLPRATMALAVIENEQHKWVSADHGMFAIKAGRIIKTLGFKSNLITTTNLEQDPLNQGKHVSIGSQWQRQVDYDSPPKFNININSTIISKTKENISILGHHFNTKVITEKVTYPGKLSNHHWTNKFWYEMTSGKLIKSEQKMAPHTDLISISYISDVVRLIEKY